MIPDFKTYIRESIWGDIHRRNSGEMVRQEDGIGNIPRLKPVDMGGTVLWADQDLVVDEIEHFTFDEACDIIENSSWRLPTVKEVAELDKCQLFCDGNNVYLESGDGKLGFQKKGVIYVFHNHPNHLDDGAVYYGWTSEPYKYSSNHIHVIIIDKNALYHSPLNQTINNQVTQSANCKCCVRLVKDK